MGGTAKPPRTAEPGRAAREPAAPPRPPPPPPSPSRSPLRSEEQAAAAGTAPPPRGERTGRPHSRRRRRAPLSPPPGASPPAPAALSRRRRPPLLTAGRLGQRGDRGLAHDFAGRRSRRPPGVQPPPRLRPGGHLTFRRGRLPRRAVRRLAGAGCSRGGCGPAAACHAAGPPVGAGPRPQRRAPAPGRRLAPARPRRAGGCGGGVGCAPPRRRPPGSLRRARGTGGAAQVFGKSKGGNQATRNFTETGKGGGCTGKPSRTGRLPSPCLAPALLPSPERRSGHEMISTPSPRAQGKRVTAAGSDPHALLR